MMDISAENPDIIRVTDDLPPSDENPPPPQDRYPDVEGNIIAYGSNRNSLGDIYLYRINDGMTIPVTATTAYERNPQVG